MANFCPKCGTGVRVGDNFCANCGRPLSNSGEVLVAECAKCNGTGVVEEYRGDPSASIFMRGIGTQKYTCDVCGGKGIVRI